MSRVVPPLCLVLALFLLISGFAVLATDRPQPSVELHRATAAADEQQREVLEEQLQNQRFRRTVAIFSIFGLAIVMGATAFVAMKPRHQQSG